MHSASRRTSPVGPVTTTHDGPSASLFGLYLLSESLNGHASGVKLIRTRANESGYDSWKPRPSKQ